MSAKKLAGALFARIFSAAFIVGGLAASEALANTDREGVAEAKMAAGDELRGRGLFQEAILRWQEAERAFARAKDAGGEVRALLQQAAAFQSLGQHHLALRAVSAAETLNGDPGDSHAAAEIKAARGSICTFGREASEAEPLLKESLKGAQATRDNALAASVLNDLGILFTAQDRTNEALAAFEKAAQTDDAELRAKALKNMADAAFTTHDYAGAERFAGQAVKAASALADGHEKAFVFLGVAGLLQQVFIEAPEHKNALRAEAFRLDEDAAKIASKTGDLRALAFALGNQGALYEFEKRDAEALALTRRAVFTAQQAQSPDSLYRWEWQTGRLLAKLNQRDAAIQAYRRAIGAVQSIRNDISIARGNANARSSFRDAVGAVYFELADLLLQRADGIKDDGEKQALLREARDTAELLKAAELEDYFQDDCVNLLKSKIKKVENISPTAAVIYIIALPTRTELLVSLPSGRLERFKVNATDDQLTETVRLFRLNLEDRTTESYLEQAQQLYTWLIKPLEPLMEKARLDTMVFVPDGALRTIPMAALHDGGKFLIEKYAVAVTPGLELMEASRRRACSRT